MKPISQLKNRAALIRGNLISPYVAWSCFFCSFLTFITNSSSLFAQASTSSSTQPAFTNAVPRSVFRETEARDPFCPVGYQKPIQTSEGGGIQISDFKLEVTGISNFGDEPIATLATGEVIEPGGAYKFKTKDGKVIVEYKVLTITENDVVVLYNNKEYTFQLKSMNLDSFEEKEESNVPLK